MAITEQRQTSSNIENESFYLEGGGEMRIPLVMKTQSDLA